MSEPSAVLKGITTLVWGTANALSSPAGAIIESFTITPKNGAPIEIEGNNGFTVAEVILDDGFNCKVNCVFDKAKAWPAAYSNVSLSIQDWANANGNTIAFACLVTSMPEITYARKKEGMIQFNLSYRPGVSP